MKKTIPVLLVLVNMAMICLTAKQAFAQRLHPETGVYEGWRLGIQAWTFRKFTFYEAVEKTASLGLGWIEAYPGQQLGTERTGEKFHHEMKTGIREQVKQKLKDAGVRLVNYGVVRLPNDEIQCRRVFSFAKDMGIETIVAEPPPEAFDLIDRLCNEYKIKVAIHNHPKPSQYWHPDKILEVCKGRSKWIGACADTGHWIRSSLDPLEMLKKLEGRIISLHFKDIKDGHDVIWGTGDGNVKQMLIELHRQRFEGVFSVEYEYNWEKSLPEIAQCVRYFNSAAGRLKSTGWRSLLEEDLANCVYNPGSWTLTDGVLTRKGGGDIWTKERFGDFILDLEFKVDKDTNSGVFIRTGSINQWIHTAIEVQVLDSYGKTEPGKHDCGAIFDCLAPTKNTVKKPGQWNHLTVYAKANRINVILNGKQIIDMDLNLWTEPHKNPDGTKNKFNTAYKDMSREGHFGFQDHGHPVWYRNIKIKTLN